MHFEVQVKQDSGGPATEHGQIRLEQVQRMLAQALADEPALKLLPGFNMGPVGVADMHRVFFSVRCDCGTAALLSVEVATSKTVAQVEDALPSLGQHLKSKAKQFVSMSCEGHSRMRSMGTTGQVMAVNPQDRGSPSQNDGRR